MRRPVDKFLQVEALTLVFACLICLFALIKGFYLFVSLALYFIVVSLICEAIAKWKFIQKIDAGKQLARAVVIFILATYLLFQR